MLGALGIWLYIIMHFLLSYFMGSLGLEKWEKVQVGKDQEKAQSEKDSHSKNRGGKKPNKPDFVLVSIDVQNPSITKSSPYNIQRIFQL